MENATANAFTSGPPRKKKNINIYKQRLQITQENAPNQPGPPSEKRVREEIDQSEKQQQQQQAQKKKQKTDHNTNNNNSNKTQSETTQKPTQPPNNNSQNKNNNQKPKQPQLRQQQSNKNDDDDGSGEEYGEDEEIQVEFLVEEGKDTDDLYMKPFIVRLFGKEKINISLLSRLCCLPQCIPYVIRAEDTDDIFGFVSIINLQMEKGEEVVQLKESIMRRAKADKSNPIAALAENNWKGVGFIFNERVVNLPNDISPLLHSCIFDDLSNRAKNNEEGFSYDYFIMVTTYYEEKAEKAKSAIPQLKSKSTVSNTTYYKPEERIYFEAAEWSTTFPFLIGDTGMSTKKFLDETRVEDRCQLILINKAAIPLLINKIRVSSPHTAQ